MGNIFGKICHREIFSYEYLYIVINWNNGYRHNWHIKLAILLLVSRCVILHVYTQIEIKERPNQKKDVIQEVRSSTEEDPGLNETDRTTHSVEGTLHCIIEDKECQDLMEAYCEKYLKQIRIIYYNMTDERIKPHKKGCFILKSKEERLGDTFINTFKKCNHISDEQSLLLIVLNKTGKKIHLPPTEEISIKLKTQILFKRGRIFESDTNIAAVSDIKQFVQGRKGDV